MDISPACMPPKQPTILRRDRHHPRFGEYMAYRSAMSSQLVEADRFDLWLKNKIEAETPHYVIFQCGEHASGPFKPFKWYKRLVGLNHETIDIFGPFETEGDIPK